VCLTGLAEEGEGMSRAGSAAAAAQPPTAKARMTASGSRAITRSKVRAGPVGYGNDPHIAGWRQR
jgi:hypothetical protein